MRTLTLVRSGIATSIQDAGRTGRQHNGVPPGGAMDEFALRTGQHQLGHRADEAALEFVYGSLAFTTSAPCRFIVTGAPVIITIDGTKSHSGQVQETQAHQMVNIKPSGKGVYSYLHVAGGIDTPLCLGSRSTSPRERLGGLNGQYLCDDDVLPLGPEQTSSEPSYPLASNISAPETLLLRFIPGFQFDLFCVETRHHFESQLFSVTSRANRMGVSLDGNPVETGLASLLSEATCYGAIQIPPDGKPIILLNDRQTVGGYPKAGAVIRGDCRRLVQSQPGQRVQFVAITPQEADRIAWLEHHYLETKLA